MRRHTTGLLDRHGEIIYVGDLVRFFFSLEEGPSHEKGASRTEMIDEVIYREGEFYFLCREIERGARASRYNMYCEVVGQADVPAEEVDAP